jgi:hypothetical protein
MRHEVERDYLTAKGERDRPGLETRISTQRRQGAKLRSWESTPARDVAGRLASCGLARRVRSLIQLRTPVKDWTPPRH